MLQNTLSVADLIARIGPRDAWKPFPPAADQRAWGELASQPVAGAARQWLAGYARATRTLDVPPLPATLYMEYARIGNRSNYQEPYFERRRRLGLLVLDACFAATDETLDAVINLLWAICEESTWCLPAHARRLPGDALPDLARDRVELFACETAMVIAETVYLLRDELMARVPGLVRRVEQQVIDRVVLPVLDGEDPEWFSGLNNWTPWCASNTLGAAMYTLGDAQTLARLIHRLCGPIDRFVEHYPEDGGCDEGPGYWGVAAGAMVMFLELLASRTGAGLELYEQPKVRRMGQFIALTHLDGPWFVNFADAKPTPLVRVPVTWRYGERIGEPALQHLAAMQARHWDPAAPPDLMTSAALTGAALTGTLRALWWLPSDVAMTPSPRPLSVWLPDTQIMVARQSAENLQGTIAVCKGGHNQESHNHNDIGQFLIYRDGRPVIVDAGAETYTARTFSPLRYTIWSIRGSGHNAPVIGEIEQKVGREHRATRVKHEAGADSEAMTLELQEAYPPEATLKRLQRTIRLDRLAGAVTVHDVIQGQPDAAGGLPAITLSLLTPQEAEVKAPGTVTLETMTLRYDPAVLTATVTTLPLDDKGLRKAWGSQLHRIELRTAGGDTEYTLAFEPT